MRRGNGSPRFYLQTVVSQPLPKVVLETEVTNKEAVRLYEKLGFIKDKRLHR